MSRSRDIAVRDFLDPRFRDIYETYYGLLKEPNTFLPQEQLLAQTDAVLAFKSGMSRAKLPGGYRPLAKAADRIDKEGKADMYENVYVENIDGRRVFIDNAIIKTFSVPNSTIAVIGNDLGVFLRLESENDGEYAFAIHKLEKKDKNALYYYISK